MTTRLRVGHVTTCRSDYGPAYWLIHDLAHHDAFELALFVGGAHLSDAHGHTVDEISRDGWPIAARVPFLDADGRPTPRALAAALAGFGSAFEAAQLDIVVLYGDRIELLPIAVAAMSHGIPIVHLCGGDITEGALDDQVRHALTKLAHVHFPSTAESAARVLQMGESAWRVHHVGDPALDHFTRGDRADLAELVGVLGFTPDVRTLLVTLHPTTLALDGVEAEVGALVAALEAYDGSVVITAPAPDPGADVIRAALEALAQRRPQTVFVPSLGSRRYRALLPVVGAMVGNSSSGLIEAATAGLPVVNIGTRQAGRERGHNVIDVPGDRDQILAAIAKASSAEFRGSLAGATNPYGDGTASAQIVRVLSALPARDKLLAKAFVTP
ncbi:MAG: UDP-N-acetylglucosamine 2-epimerase [Deltaproteobacteria bacterium]